MARLGVYDSEMRKGLGLEASSSAALLCKVAAEIKRLGLTLPVSLFLEIHRPLVHVTGAALLFSRPLAFLILGRAGATALEEVFSSRHHIDLLIDLLNDDAARIQAGEVKPL